MTKSQLLKRIPPFNDILLVSAFTALLVYGRMLYIFTWKLPSWLKFLTVGEMLSVLSYSLSFVLLETAGIVLVLVLISFLLPQAWFRDVFVIRSVWMVAIWLVSLMVFFERLSELGLDLLVVLYLWTGITLAVALAVAFLATRVRFMRSLATWIADRAVIFLFIFVPASLIGTIVVAARNIF